MRTSREIRRIENYLFRKMDPASRLLFEARLLLDPVLKARVECQKRVYALIRQSGRRYLKGEVVRVHHQLFTDPSKTKFQNDVLQLFSKG